MLTIAGGILIALAAIVGFVLLVAAVSVARSFIASVDWEGDGKPR